MQDASDSEQVVHVKFTAALMKHVHTSRRRESVKCSSVRSIVRQSSDFRIGLAIADVIASGRRSFVALLKKVGAFCWGLDLAAVKAFEIKVKSVLPSAQSSRLARQRPFGGRRRSQPTCCTSNSLHRSVPVSDLLWQVRAHTSRGLEAHFPAAAPAVASRK